MDIDKLKTLIKGKIKDGTLRLSDTILESDSIKQLFDSYLQSDELVIEDVPPPHETTDSITVQGKGGNLPFTGMDPLTAEFRVINEEAALLLTAGAQDGWTFQSSFPVLKDTFLPELEFDPAPTMRFASYNNPPQSQYGLQFEGALKMTSPLSELAWLIGGKSEIDLAGPIQIQMDVPQMALAAELAGPVNVGFFELPSMQFELRCDAVVNDKDKPPSFQAAMRFATDIRFRANGTDVDLGIGADFVNTPGQIQFYIKPNQAVKAGLAELRSLMHGADLGKIIPSDFHLEDIIELNNIVLQVDPLARKLTSVLIGIKTAQGWSILHDPKIAVDSVELVFRLNDPMDVNNFAKNLELAFFGEIAIGSDGKLDVSAVYPGFEFSGELKPGTNIDLAQVATHFISDAADVPSIKVTEFNFDVAPSTKAYSVSVTVDSDWKIPLGSTHLQIGEVKLLIDHPQPSVTNAEVGGWLTIAGGTLKVDWKLPGDFQLAGTLPTIHLDQIISELSADKLRADFPAIVLENSQVYVERRSDSSFYFALGTMVENFGAIELEFIEANKQTGFVFGFLLPGAWSLANLTEVFDPLKFLQFKDASMIVSSIDDPNFQFRSFTEPNFNFPPQPPSAPAGVKKGLSLYAELLIGTGGLEVLANLLKGLDGLSLAVMIPEKYQDTSVVATLGEQHNLIGSYVILDDLSIKIQPDQSPFALHLEVTFNVHDAQLKLAGDVAVHGEELDFDLRTETPWPEPFGIRGLTIDKLGIGFSLGAVITLSLAGEIAVGSGDSRLTLEAGMEFNAEEELAPDVFLAKEVGTIKLAQIINTFTAAAVPKQLVNIELSNFQLIVVANPAGWTNPDDGKHYSAGLAVAGTLEFYGLTAKFAIQVNYSSGIYAMGQIDKPLVIGNVVTLANAVNPAQGPYVEINTANSPYLKLSASLTLFEIVSQKIDAEIDQDSFYVHFQYSVVGLGNADIKAYLKNKSEFAFNAKAKFKVSKVVIKVGSLNLGTLNLDLLLDAHFAIAVSTSGSFSLSIGAEFDLDTLHLKLPDVAIQEKITKLADLPQVFKRQLEAMLWDLGKSLFQDAEALFAFVRRGALTLTDDIGKILNHYLHVSLKEAAKLLKSVASIMQYDADKVGALLKDGFDAEEAELAEAMRYAGYEAEETAGFLERYFKLGASQVADFLRKGGYPIDSITRVLRISYGWSAEQVAKLYKNVWGLGDTTVNWALQQAGYAANEIEKAMYTVFGWFKDIFEKIEDNIDPRKW